MEEFLKSLDQYEKKSIYINKHGLTDLIWSSKKEEAVKLKKFISDELLPTLFKTGHYDMNLDLDTSYAKKDFFRKYDPAYNSSIVNHDISITSSFSMHH
jgi:prophage antirepressor-like protein